MVQRKVSNKLGIQADQVKSEKRLANLKPSYSYQYQDGKNRGPEMKKRVKKSRSIKLSDIESLRSSTLKQTISQPGKPPPLNGLTSAVATPQKLTPARTINGSPNYMKSTSSSEARKESLQVSSSRYSQTGSDDKNLRRRSCSNSKISSGSSNKAARSSTKSSSLKLVRTLTKTPSFKPARAGSKKCSRVVICADINAQKATCSSTLKDSKFPDYLVLNPGATEAERTSEVKGCPFTYCSLNGHHHTPLPPLKCFLSARRRLLKTQKSMKLEALSPRRMKPVGEGNSPSSPLIQEGGLKFFIEIDAKNKEHNDDQQIAENLSDGSTHSEIDFENNEQYGGIYSLGGDIIKSLLEEEKADDPDKGYPPIAAQTEGAPGNYCNRSDFEDESNVSSEDNDSISEVSDMEWEECQFSTLELNTEANDSIKEDKESDLDDGYSSEIVNHDLLGEPTIKSDNTVINCSGKIPVDEIFEEESASSELQQSEEDSDSEMNYAEHDLETVDSSQVHESDQESFTVEAETDLIGVMITSDWTEDPITEPTASIEEIEEKIGVCKPENEANETRPQFGVVETYHTTEATEETLNDEQHISLQDDNLTVWLQSQISDPVVIDEDDNGNEETKNSKTNQTCGFDREKEIFDNEAGDRIEEREKFTVTKKSIGVQVPDDLVEVYQDDVETDDKRNHNIIDPCQLECSAKNTHSCQDILDIFSAAKHEHSSEVESAGINVAENHNNLENDEVKIFNIRSSMESEEQSDSRMNKNSLDTSGEQVVGSTQSNGTETLPMTGCKTIWETDSTSLPLECKSGLELPSASSNQKWAIRSKRTINEEEELRNFNPREPNYLPVVPDPETEKVDLKHQMMDERKNSEEWMVDFALRQAVTKLAPARKKKVALLVEAFETVIPVPKWETRLPHSSADFAPARPIQACS